MSAKSLTQLFRVINPNYLKKKDRGKPTEASEEIKVKQYGELDAKDFVPGTEVLEEDKGSENEEEFEEASDDESGSDSEEWVEVSHSEDEVPKKEEKEDEEDEVSVVDKVKKAAHISSSRILTQEDFRKVRIAQLAKQLEAAKPRRFSRKDEDKASEETGKILEKKEVVPLTAIEKTYKKARANRESRLATVLEGREGGRSLARKRER